MIIDGLYISNVWVCDAEAVLTFQGNDLTKPDARTASYSSTFTLPDSLTVRDLLQGAEQVDSGGAHPYKQLPAKLIDEGEVIFSGVVEFVSFQAGWKVNLLDSMIAFFDAIKDKKLSQLNLSSFDHPWTLEYINSLAGQAEGVVYPLIDYGGIDKGVFAYDTLTPALYIKTLLGQICQEAGGYKPVGEWVNDPLLKAMALPFVGANPKSHDKDWVDDRSARVTTQPGDPIVLKNGHPIDLLLPLANDAESGQYFQGKLRPFNTQRNVYVCPQNMRVIIEAQAIFRSITFNGAAEIRLILERNGQKVKEAYWSEGGFYDHLGQPDILALSESVDCGKDDEISLRLTGSSRTSISSYLYLFSQNPGDMWASFRPDASIRLGDTWPIAENVPDMLCSDLVLSIAKLMSGTFEVDAFRKTIRLNRLDDTLDDLANAVDWSNRIEESEEPELAVQIEPYTKTNLLKWKEADEKGNIGYGDGVIECPNSPNPQKTTLFELPFMASVQSLNVVDGYGFPILIKTRTISVSGESTTVNTNDAEPRLILIEPTKTFTVKTKIMDRDGVLSDVPVILTGCWFAVRPEGVRTLTNNFSLAFSPVLGQTEEPLIVRYFRALKKVLRRPRMFSPTVYLDPSDIANLQLSRPIRLKRVRAGSLDLNDNYYYLNKVASYRSGRTCRLTLIAL